MILIFDLFNTLVEDIRIDFNIGLKSLWERYYKDKCSFDEIRAFGEEVYLRLQDAHKRGLELPFAKGELPLYAEKYGGSVIDMNIEEEAAFLSRSNEVRVFDGLLEMLDLFTQKGIPMFVLSNSVFRAGALRMMLDSHGIGKYFEQVWSSADFGKVKPSAELFEMAVREILDKYPDCTGEDMLFVGDTYDTDIVGAHNAGLRTAWINLKNAPDVKGFADHQIRNVTELMKLVI